MDRRPPAPNLGHLLMGQIDQARKGLGQILDGVGAGPRSTPSQVLAESPGVRVRHYAGAGPGALPVVLVAAPIKRSYIWDLQPDRSVVARCREHGLAPYLVEWMDPSPGEQEWGLEEYADRMLGDCVAAVRAEAGRERLPLIGHSLGGTVAAVFAARHPEAVAGLVLLETPLHFGRHAGAFAPLVAVAPHAAWLTARQQGVPGTFLDLVSALAAPAAFQFGRYADLALSLGSPATLVTHMRVERWTLDEFALPARLFEDIVERLYRRDELMAGTLAVAGERVGPKSVTCPLATVFNPRSRVIPASSVLPFHEAAASSQKLLRTYDGDVGVAVQHVGVLVGRSAHHRLWPELLGWLTAAA